MNHAEVYGRVRGSKQTMSLKVQKEFQIRDKRLDAHDLLFRKVFKKDGIDLPPNLENIPLEEWEPRSVGSHHSPIDVEVNGERQNATHVVKHVAMDSTPFTKVHYHSI